MNRGAHHFRLRAALGRLARDLPYALGRGARAIWFDLYAPMFKLVFKFLIALAAVVWLILLSLDALGVVHLPPPRWPTWRP
jgi:hypothetical protein